MKNTYRDIEFKYEITSHVKNVIDYLLDHKYSINKIIQMAGKIRLYISKDGYELMYEIYYITADFKVWITNFESAFKTHKKFMDGVKEINK